MSGVALVVISDGRGYLAESIPSLIANAKPEWFSSAFVVCDGDDEHHAIRAEIELADWFSHRIKPVGVTLKPRQGGAAAIDAAWKALSVYAPGTDYVFHVEEDFTFRGRIPLPEMIAVLKEDPNLANMVLRRGPHGAEGPGGYIGDDPQAHVQHLRDGIRYLVHDNGFWLNPCVYPASIAARGWPEHGHEHDFSAKLRADGYRFAVYGTHDDPPRVTHIGDRRAAAWTW